MNDRLLERLRGFRLPQLTAIPDDHYVVVQLIGVDFEGIFNSPDFAFENAFDARFGKLMVRTAGHLLGGDACGIYAYSELMQISVLLKRRVVAKSWGDATDLQNYLVGLAGAKMTMLLEEEALFLCRLYSFSSPDLVMLYFTWRQQMAYASALDGYCRVVLSQREGATVATVSTLLEGLGPTEKEEILSQNDIDFSSVPAWQRYGTGVRLGEGGAVAVDTALPHDGQYNLYLKQFLTD
jgi:tRNA(His) 5'-end guanylyltransferase